MRTYECSLLLRHCCALISLRPIETRSSMVLIVLMFHGFFLIERTHNVNYFLINDTVSVIFNIT